MLRALAAFQSACARQALLITLVIGLASTGLGFWLMWRSDGDKFETEQKAEIGSRINTLSIEIGPYDDTVSDIQIFAETLGGQVPLAMLHTYGAHQVPLHPGILALDYSPRVYSKDRAGFEAAARTQGLTGFQITELDPDGTVRKAGERAEYFPVYGLYPESENQFVLGLDAKFSQEALFERARDTGDILASDPLRVIGHGDQWGFLLVGPIYESFHPATVEERREQLRGYAIAVFRVGDMIESILGTSAAKGYDEYIFDGPFDHPGPLLYVHSSRLRKPGQSPPPFEKIDPSAVRLDRVVFDQHEFVIATVPLVRWYEMPIEIDVMMVGALGLVCTAIGVLYVFTTRRRAASLRRLAANLRDRENWLRTVYDSIGEAIFVVDPPTGRFIEVNRSACEMFGYGREELLACTVTDLSSGEPGFTVGARREKLDAMVPGQKQIFDWHCKGKDGRLFWVELASVLAMLETKPVVLSTLRDMTERLRNQENLVQLARTDSLTKLPNRAVFVEALHQSIARSRRDRHTFAVLYLDLDHFKDINDTMGHPMGDKLLVAVSERLRAHVREIDTVARFGGDEFAVLASDLQAPDEAAVVASKILEKMREPLMLDGSPIRIGSSIGIAVSSPGETTPEILLSHADLALYRAKADGRGVYRYFTDSLDEEVRERVTLAEDLREAIESEALDLCYQPQIDVSTGHIVGVEALLRWQHPTRGVISPSTIVPIAERSGLMVSLGLWVLRRACTDAKKWREEGISVPLVAVNVSAVQLKAAFDFEAAVNEIMTDTGMPPPFLELELTESTLMEASLEHNDVLRRMHSHGIRLAIDDFGTGYSSLDYLRRFPVDRIKIAQTFVADLASDPGDVAIVKATIGLAAELGIDVIAEGVEQDQQRQLLTEWGCHEIQGFFYSQPLSENRVRSLLRAGAIALGAEQAAVSA